MGTKRLEDQYSEEETARRRDEVIRRMANTPPKPHSEMKIGKSRAKAKVVEAAKSERSKALDGQ
jgi:hypothetical protein